MQDIGTPGPMLPTSDVAYSNIPDNPSQSVHLSLHIIWHEYSFHS